MKERMIGVSYMDIAMRETGVATVKLDANKLEGRTLR